MGKWLSRSSTPEQISLCPGLVESVAKVADKHDMLWAPGCMTPTEIIFAEQLGTKIIKLFPGNILGPGFLEAIKALFPNLQFMPTGGVDLSRENIAGWFKAGVSAVGMGSKLIDKEILQNENYDLLTKRTTDVMEVIRSVRS
jgi:2-dehydro-3-deoxyphosphogluconate aldolase / (4S)-4-hydroxy-2-oxoglutarate aldolase